MIGLQVWLAFCLLATLGWTARIIAVILWDAHRHGLQRVRGEG